MALHSWLARAQWTFSGQMEKWEIAIRLNKKACEGYQSLISPPKLSTSLYDCASVPLHMLCPLPDVLFLKIHSLVPYLIHVSAQCPLAAVLWPLSFKQHPHAVTLSFSFLYSTLLLSGIVYLFIVHFLKCKLHENRVLVCLTFIFLVRITGHGTL